MENEHNQKMSETEHKEGLDKRNTHPLRTPALLCGQHLSLWCCCHLSPPSGKKEDEDE